jgi:hypothetical protein
MAGSVSLASISFIFSLFWDISKKPPEVGGFFLQFGKKIFYLYQFHDRIVNGFCVAVKEKSCAYPRQADAAADRNPVISTRALILQEKNRKMYMALERSRNRRRPWR